MAARTFKGVLSTKQTFVVNGNGYRAGADGTFTTEDADIIQYFEGSPYWEEIVTAEAKPAEVVPEPTVEVKPEPTVEVKPEPTAEAKPAKGK